MGLPSIQSTILGDKQTFRNNINYDNAQAKQFASVCMERELDKQKALDTDPGILLPFLLIYAIWCSLDHSKGKIFVTQKYEPRIKIILDRDDLAGCNINCVRGREILLQLERCPFKQL